MKHISVIIPFYNEDANLPILHKQLSKVLNGMKGFSSSIILVNDGSDDRSRSDAIKLAKTHSKVHIVHRRVRSGKGAALADGIDKAKGEYIVFMDGDLQDDPADLPELIALLDEGYDLVNGWRQKRKDSSAIRMISTIGNSLLWRHLLGSSFHDMNCGYKALKREVLDSFTFYGDNYRFIPYLAEQQGFAVTEMPVNNRDRNHGVSKYTAAKLFFGLIDTLTTYFIIRFSQKPFHFFGAIGGAIFATGFIVAGILTYQWYVYGEVLHRRPALLFAMLLLIVGVQFFLTGIIAELVVYLTHIREKKHKS